MAFRESSAEIATRSPHFVYLQFYAILPKTDEEVLFSDCADFPYDITLSDNENFEVKSRSGKCTLQ